MRRIKYPVGLADLADAFRHLRPDRAGAELIARALGFEARSLDEEALPSGSLAADGHESRKAKPSKSPRASSRGAGAGPGGELDSTLEVRQLTRPRRSIRLPRSIRKSQPLPDSPRSASYIPPPAPLLARRLLRAFLMDAVGDDLPDESINIDESVEQIAHFQLHRPLPRNRRRGFRSGLQLWIDESPAMQPFRADVEDMCAAIRLIVGPSYEGEFFFDKLSLNKEGSWSDGEALDPMKLKAGANVLLLTDLGIGRPPLKPRATSSEWRGFARTLASRASRVVAVVPYSSARWPAGLSKWMKIVHWNSSRSQPAGNSKEQVRLLARALSIASQIDPALLREARRFHLPNSDAGLEADFLFGAMVSVSNPRAIALRKEVLLDLRAELVDKPAELARASNFLRKYRERYRKRPGYNFRINFEEELVFQGLRHAFADEGRVRHSLSRAVRSLVESEGDMSLARWVLNCLPELPAWINNLSEAQYLRTAAELRLGFNPADVDPGAFKGGDRWLLPKPINVGVRLRGDGLEFHEPPESDDPVIEVPATNPRVIFVEETQGSSNPVRFQSSLPVTVKIPALPIELTTLAGARYRLTGTQPDEDFLPPGVRLLRTLEGHRGAFWSLTFDPTGRTLASGGVDGAVKLWDVASGELLSTLEGHKHSVMSVKFDPTGRMLASGGADNIVKLWEAASGKLLHNIRGHTGAVFSVAFDPSGRKLASGGVEGAVQLWNVASGKLLLTLEGQKDSILSVTFDPTGRMLAGGCVDHTVKLWDVASGKLLRTLGGHKNFVRSVTFDPTGRMLASGGIDGTVKLWDVASGKLLRTLEGYDSAVCVVAFSTNGRLLASRSDDQTVRLWSCETWETVAVIQESKNPDSIQGLAFHPSLPLLASIGSKPDAPENEQSRLIHFWELDLDVLLGKTGEAGQASKAVHHTTAKIVLVGDSGVGKTGLGWRLAHGEFKEHSSTHGQQFWILDQLSARRADGTECEAILWDMAGQPDYRLTHALFLDDADLALILFDPTDTRDPLQGVEFWLRQLRSGGKQSSDFQDICPTILVGARADRGESRLTQEEIEDFCRRRGISGGYLTISAKEGVGLNELLQRMKEQIPWDQKSTTVTTVTFKRIKDYVLRLKENRRLTKVIFRPQELRNRLEKTDKQWKFTDAEMMTAVGHMSNYGYVRVLRTSSGEERILLAPELLNNLAASFVLEARRNPKGLGLLEEKRLLAGEYQFRELDGLSEEERYNLVDSAALLFLQHNICIRETDPLSGKSYLVFPELINLKKPLLDDEHHIEDGTAYTVSGAIENVYASLVVLLGYTMTFTRTDQWRNQARYEVGDGLICGFRQERERPGEIDLVLYFGTNVGKPVRTLFQGLFESFLARRNLSVFRYEPIICGKCHQPLERAVVRERLRSDKDFAFCPVCGEKLRLPKADEPIQLTQTEQRKVDEQQRIAAGRSRFEQALFQIMSFAADQKLMPPECFISYAWGDKDHERWVERNLATDLQKAGIAVLLDRWENDRAGASVSRFIDRIVKSSKIIVVGTPLYRKKYENKDTSTGYAVAAEWNLITRRMRGTEAQKETVLPVLLDGDEVSSFPALVQGRVYADFRNERAYFITAFDLILDLYGIPHHHQAVADLRESLTDREMR